MTKFDLIIWDCDGVLIDSEWLGSQAWGETLATLGITATRAELASFVGISEDDTAKAIAAHYRIDLSAETVMAKRRRTAELFDAKLKPIKGVSTLLDGLRSPHCVASGSSLARLERTLKLTGLFAYFAGRIFSAEQVEHGKPAPDLFFFAAQQMRIEPPRCLVIEDGLPGTRAGVAAGMTVWGFTGGSHIQPEHEDKLREAGAKRIFPDMAAVAAALFDETAPHAR